MANSEFIQELQRSTSFDLDWFLAGVEKATDGMLDAAGIADEATFSTEGEVVDPFKPQVKILGTLALSFTLPTGLILQFSPRGATDNMDPERYRLVYEEDRQDKREEAAIFEDDGQGLFLPTGATIDISRSNPLKGRAVHAVFNESSPHPEVEVRTDIVHGQYAAMPLKFLTETNRSSFYYFDIVPEE